MMQQTCHFHVPTVLKSGILTSWNPQGLSRDCFALHAESGIEGFILGYHLCILSLTEQACREECVSYNHENESFILSTAVF